MNLHRGATPGAAGGGAARASSSAAAGARPKGLSVAAAPCARSMAQGGRVDDGDAPPLGVL